MSPMKKIIIKDEFFNIDNPLIIAEIGQNHNGSIDLAKLLIDIVARPITDKFNNKQFKGMDAVKFTKRDLKQELSKSQMDRIYNSPNSFGKTYGEHREYLELSDIEHFELFNYAKSKNLDFIETICGIGGLSLLKLFKLIFTGIMCFVFALALYLAL